MKTIIIPTDFSPVATNALHYGMNMALAVNADLLLFNAFQIPVALTDVPLAFVSVDDLKASVDENLLMLKREVEHISSGKLNVSMISQLGEVSESLEELCTTIDPFAIVMGTKGHTGLEKVLFGSTSLTVIHHITWPVICVPPGKQFGTGIKKIGMVSDFKDTMPTIPTKFIRQFIDEFHSELHVLNTDQPAQVKSGDSEPSLLLETVLGEFSPVYHFIDRKDVEAAINEFSEKNNLDLVITIPKKQGLLEGVFKSDSTKKLMREAHVPVMCMHQ